MLDPTTQANQHLATYMQLYANYTHPSLHVLKLLMLTGVADVRHNLRPMSNHLLDHKKCSGQLQLPILQSLQTYNYHSRAILLRQLRALLPIRTTLKYCLDCTQHSSRSPFSRSRRARNMENIPILPITLKLGLCNKRSNCTGASANGY